MIYARRCPSCGLETEQGEAGCQALFDETLARDFSDYRYFRVHRTVVDAYALQHPARYCASAKSLVAHLAACVAPSITAAILPSSTKHCNHHSTAPLSLRGHNLRYAPALSALRM